MVDELGDEAPGRVPQQDGSADVAGGEEDHVGAEPPVAS